MLTGLGLLRRFQFDAVLVVPVLRYPLNYRRGEPFYVKVVYCWVELKERSFTYLNYCVTFGHR